MVVDLEDIALELSEEDQEILDRCEQDWLIDYRVEDC